MNREVCEVGMQSVTLLERILWSAFSRGVMQSVASLMNALPSARPEQPDSHLLSLDEELLVAILEHLSHLKVLRRPVESADTAVI